MLLGQAGEVGALSICQLAAGLAATEIGVSVQDVLQPHRHSRASAGARAIAMYLAHVGLGLPLNAVARGFCRHRSTVTHACRRIEEQREAAEWDERISALEDGLRQRLSGLDGEARHDA